MRKTIILLFILSDLLAAQASSIVSGAALPGTCAVADVYFKTTSPIGLHVCRATDTWAYLSGIESLTTSAPCQMSSTGMVCGGTVAFTVTIKNPLGESTLLVTPAGTVLFTQAGYNWTIPTSSGLIDVKKILLNSDSGQPNYVFGANAAGNGQEWKNLVAGLTNALQVTHSTGQIEVDINTAVVPQKSAANTWTGLNMFDLGAKLTPTAYGSLATCNAGAQGRIASVNDSNTNTWAASIAAGGTYKVLAYCNGTSWTVAGR